MSNEWVIHIWGKNRDNLALTDVEKFHLDILKTYEEQQKRFDRILVNIAMDDVKNKKLFNFLKSEVKKVVTNKNIEFKSCQNNPELGEYVTFRPYVFDRIGEDVNVFYTHFKGYRSYLNVNRESYPTRVSDLCEMFWSYIMYRYSLDFDDAQDKLKDRCVYCWFVWKRTKIIEDYFYTYQKQLLTSKPELKDLVADTMGKHSPGSFCWYNLKKIGEELKDKPDVTGIDTETLVSTKDGKIPLCTHFCELYLMQFLNEEQCYSINDFNKEWMSIKNTAYITLYPSKIIARDLIDEFNDYLFEKGIM